MVVCTSCDENVVPKNPQIDFPEENSIQASIRMQMKDAFSWQIKNLKLSDGVNGWATAVFYIGVMESYNLLEDRDYLNAVRNWGERNDWKIKTRPRNADDQTAGQVYLDMYRINDDATLIADIKRGVDEMVQEPKKGREDWYWCDALFMAPPVFAMLGQITSEAKYYDLLHSMWWDVHDFLYDEAEFLYYRDRTFFGRETENGEKIFWSRGNGWVIAGLVRVMEHLPKNDPEYIKYSELLQQMASKMATVQQEDGFWRSSLLDPLEYPYPETSGTGLITYAISWGINNGILSKEEYLPVVEKGWDALTSALGNSGKLGWVQQPSGAPGEVAQSDNQEYGTGAFLLTGTELYKLYAEDEVPE